MDIKVGLSIYNKAWLIEPSAALSLLDYWERAVRGESVFSMDVLKGFKEDEETNYEAQEKIDKFFASNGVIVAPTSYGAMQRFEGFEGSRTAIIPLRGPLMKADYCGDFGTVKMKQLLNKARNTSSVETIILNIDSPGGTVSGTEAFAQEVEAAAKEKNVITFVDDMMCSAAYWCGAPADEIVAGSESAIIGSIGTMSSWYDYTKALEEEGIVLHEYYATRSKDKNKVFSEAEKGNSKLLIQEHLDPMNDIFLKNVQRYRGHKLNLDNEDVLTGKLYNANKAKEYGLIDGIASLEDTLNTAMEMAPKKKKKHYAMSTNNIRFAAIMAVAAMESMKVTDDGFALSEEQAEAVNSQLEQDKVSLKTLTSRVTELEAELETAQGQASEAVAKENAELKAQVEQLTTAKEKAEADLAEANKEGKLFLQNGGCEGEPKQDDAGAHEETEKTPEEQVAKSPYMKAAKEALGR